MKKLVSLILIATLACSFMFALGVQADEGRVEIKFCVGDDTLLINGNPVAVEKPYVTDADVTLVPVRVITEAFGAKVDWIEKNQTVILTYPDVNINLQIGNSVAEVNGRAETLLSAPELAGGSTMVPLRFISENFGAEVSYNEATEEIIVLKEIGLETGTTVEGNIQFKYVGDSYYGWSIETPADMQLDYRYFDGTYTAFVYDENNWIDISIYANEEEYDIDKSFDEYIPMLDGLIVSKADKNAIKNTIHIEAWDSFCFYEFYEISTDKYTFIVSGNFELDRKEILSKGKEIISTFCLDFEPDETYDLSNAADGMRKYTMDVVDFSVAIPQNLTVNENEKVLNSLYVGSVESEDNESCITVDVFSKDSVGSAQKWAEDDRNYNKKYLNKKISTISDIKKSYYNGLDAYEYEVEIDGTLSKAYHKDAYFEKGEYVYNIHIGVKLPNDDKVSYADKILNTVEIGNLDYKECGPIIKLDTYEEGISTYDGLINCKFEIPKSFKTSGDDFSVNCFDTHFALSIIAQEVENGSYNDAKSELKSSVEFQEEMGFTVVEPVKDVTLGKTKYAKAVTTTDDYDTYVYMETYATYHKGHIYTFSFMCDEAYYSEASRKELTDILASAIYY